MTRRVDPAIDKRNTENSIISPRPLSLYPPLTPPCTQRGVHASPLFDDHDAVSPLNLGGGGVSYVVGGSVGRDSMRMLSIKVISLQAMTIYQPNPTYPISNQPIINHKYSNSSEHQKQNLSISNEPFVYLFCRTWVLFLPEKDLMTIKLIMITFLS